MAQAFRPSHADFTYFKKYDGFNDYRGGGRSSARETAVRVAAGAVAKMILQQHGIRITAYTQQVFDIKLTDNDTELAFENIEKILELEQKYFPAFVEEVLKSKI